MADKTPPKPVPRQPEMIPMPRPPEERGGGGYVPPPPNPQEDLEFVAALAANTQSQVGQIAENILEGSTNLKPQKFDAHAMVKQHINASGAETPTAQPAQLTQQVMQQPIQPQQPIQAPAIIPATPPPAVQLPAAVPVYDDGQMLRRLLAIEDKLDRLEQMGDKILKSLLKKNTKQVTIRFDDPKDTKQK